MKFRFIVLRATTVERGAVAGHSQAEHVRLSLAIPFAWVADAGSGVAKGDVGSTVFTGEATVEVEALDSVSSQQLVAHIETEVGKKYNWHRGVTKGITGYVNAYSKWNYTKRAMDDWAHLLRVRLDAAHGITDKK